VIGIDSGTQSLRAGLFDLTGQPLVYAVREYPIAYPRVGWAEQNPDDWWRTAAETVSECMAKSGARPEDVVGISADGTSCTVVCVDRRGNPVRPGILWMDVRAHQQAERVTATGHPVLKYVGGKESAEWMLPKALWLKEHEPQSYEKADRIVESTDFLMHKLTGRWAASLCNVTCKWNYASPEGGYPVSLLDALGLPELRQKWPDEVLAMGDPAGELTAEAAKALGLRPGIPVAEGGIDAYTGMLGLAVTRPGRMALVMGSSTCHMALSDRPIFGTGVWGPYPDALLRGTWVLEGGQTATGSIVKWFKDNFAHPAQAAAAAQGRSPYELLDEEAAKVSAGSEGLVVADWWQGNRTPIRDPLVRGAIWGLGLKHTPAHIFRAIYEGTAYGTRHILEDLAAHGFQATEIYACGGGAKSALWLQIHADVCGLPIHLTAVPEATTLGSAICAAVGAGRFPSLDEAARAMVRVTSTVRPDDKNRDTYDFYYRKYIATYDALAPSMHEVTRRVEAG
jgi:FGGY-family pentulose kinase